MQNRQTGNTGKGSVRLCNRLRILQMIFIGAEGAVYQTRKREPWCEKADTVRTDRNK